MTVYFTGHRYVIADRGDLLGTPVVPGDTVIMLGVEPSTRLPAVIISGRANESWVVPWDALEPCATCDETSTGGLAELDFRDALPSWAQSDRYNGFGNSLRFHLSGAAPTQQDTDTDTSEETAMPERPTLPPPPAPEGGVRTVPVGDGGFVPFSRTFGIELELSSPISKAQLRARLRRAGVNVRTASWNGNDYHVWQLKDDSSIEPEYDYYDSDNNHTAIEVVSPVLDWSRPDHMAQVRAVVQVLNEVGCTVNESCGYHVHVNVGDLDGPALADFVSRFCRRQRSLFDHLLAEDRRDGRWARHITSGERDALVRYANQSDASMFTRTCDRYVTMNTNHYARRGTVEFRAHEGTLDIKVILSWLGVIVAHVEAARRNVDIAVPNGSTVDVFLARLVEADLLAPALKAWALGDMTPDDLTIESLVARVSLATEFDRLLALQGVTVA